MRVTTEELRAAALALLEHLDKTGQKEFEIEEDYYWFVSQEEVYNPYQSPKELTLGQLSHDLEEMQALAHHKREPLGYAMVWLAAVMRRVGEKSVG
ncbi:MAG: hypothetical protein IPM54_20410 [Polyangiaceae bacterium]|nr:hypothetical protein [Polyangiaceae bacterium]